MPSPMECGVFSAALTEGFSPTRLPKLETVPLARIRGDSSG